MKTLISVATLLFATSISAQTGIVNSRHNFASQAWSQNQICLPCHATHDNDRDPNLFNQNFLWNHSSSNATYAMYTSPQLQGTTDPQPTGNSVLCLGCHDGTVALDSFSGAAGNSFIMPTARVPGAQYWNGNNGDLSNTHPISITYEPSQDPELNPVTAPFGGTTIDDILENGKVQCSSCHDVHNTDVAPNTPLLRITNIGSQLCLACHNK
jgi:predicted CXXCH cytochrome family protein